MGNGKLRWRLADDEANGQQTLFDDPTGWHAGHGEFRGLEFLHVRAKRIINEVPAASRMPFRYTINAYRGCSHACVYCQAGETKILMADGRTKALADVRPGDRVYGTVRRDRHRRYVATEVLDHWSTVKPAYRVVLEDGTELVAGGDHRFLTERGWKHVTGVAQGAARRPFLTVDDRLIGTGHFADTPAHDAHYRSGYLCGISGGDAMPGLEALLRSQEWLSASGLGTQQFVFQEKAVGADRAMGAVRTQVQSRVGAIRRSVEWPDRPPLSWTRGFVAAIFDAQGTYSGGILRICGTDPGILRRVASSLAVLGFGFAVESGAIANSPTSIRLRGGLREELRFFHTVDPAITGKRTIENVALEPDARLGIVAVEPLRLDLALYDISTGTGDFIADGVVSHNCFARPTHEYLGLDAGEDFERRLVVKINAVERTRAEVASPKWAGDAIAMGTNTDPYQRCEGKYRLTRGIVEVLGEARNPFSILTKSTLILRDVDVLTQAAKRTDVRAAFSIGTLDEEVWRATEPGTPHPKRRVEAVRRLNEAGIPTAVLLAPVLPGLSDSPEQLEAVSQACLDAGATSVTPILLHLRPGVREQFMAWLRTARPDLVAQYEAMYRRVYAPKAARTEAWVRTGAIRPFSAKPDVTTPTSHSGARFPRR